MTEIEAIKQLKVGYLGDTEDLVEAKHIAIKALEKQIRDKNELIIHVMHGYDTLQAPTGEDCFGCYIHGKHEIYVADNIPTDQLFHTIAHEYMHYLQDIEGKKFDEEEANAFAWSVFTPCYQKGKRDIAEKAIELFKKEKDREKPFSTTNILWNRAISLVEDLLKKLDWE